MVAVGLVYGRSLGFEFVWDDISLVLHPVYANFDWKAVLTGPGNGLEYLPVRDLSLMLDHALFGPRPFGFHAVNVLLFTAAAGLVYVLYASLLAASREEPMRARAAELAVLSSLVFALHPLQVEPVAFVAQRNTLLATLLSICALLSHLHYSQRRSASAYTLSLLFTAAALLSKASAVCLPFLLLVVHLYCSRGEALLRVIRTLLPHLLLAMAVVGLHLFVSQATGLARQGLSPVELLTRLPRAVFVPEFYLLQFLWPAELTIEYDLDVYRSRPIVYGTGALLLMGAWAILVIRGWRDRTWVWLCATGLAFAILPVTNVIPTHPPVADRYVQLLLVWLAPLVCVPLAIRLPRRLAFVIGSVLLLGLAILSSRQLPVWQDDEALYRHAIAVNPGARQALRNLGVVLTGAGRVEEAIPFFEQLAAVDPDDFHLDFALGSLALRDARLEEAEVLLRSAARKRGEFRFLVDMKLGELHLQRGEVEAAREAYQRAHRAAARVPHAEAQRRSIEVQLRRIRAQQRRRN